MILTARPSVRLVLASLKDSAALNTWIDENIKQIDGAFVFELTKAAVINTVKSTSLPDGSDPGNEYVGAVFFFTYTSYRVIQVRLSLLVWSNVAHCTG